VSPADGLVVRPLSPIPDVHPGDDLAALLVDVVPADLADGDVLVVAHKVVSKAEGRVRRLEEVEPGDLALSLAAEHRKDPRLVQAVLDESVEIVRARDGVLVCETRHGLVCANAGVDQSNVLRSGEVVLLPEDPDGSARELRRALAAARGCRPAVVIADSFGRAWRLGQTDVALGVAGLVPLDHWIGRPDAYGRELRASSIAIADAVAAAADLVRSKDSRQPAVLVRGLERYVTAEDGPGGAALRRPREEDLFR
jgi:coenzyme F420-0:L-glutamate ligase/coenzyme F420-1:gamma-L-glutamate ligase